jgi:hypothetical protein
MSNELVLYDAMRRAIDACLAVDEVKDIRDRAMALALYSKQAQNHEAERRAVEIRVRAERKAGELLLVMAKATGGKPYQEAYWSESPTSKTLAEMGISKDQSSEWQDLAKIPIERFEAELAAPEMPSTRGIVARVEQSNEEYRSRRSACRNGNEEYRIRCHKGRNSGQGWRARKEFVALPNCRLRNDQRQSGIP